VDRDKLLLRTVHESRTAAMMRNAEDREAIWAARERLCKQQLGLEQHEVHLLREKDAVEQEKIRYTEKYREAMKALEERMKSVDMAVASEQDTERRLNAERQRLLDDRSHVMKLQEFVMQREEEVKDQRQRLQDREEELRLHAERTEAFLAEEHRRLEDRKHELEQEAERQHAAIAEEKEVLAKMRRSNAQSRQILQHERKGALVKEEALQEHSEYLSRQWEEAKHSPYLVHGLQWTQKHLEEREAEYQQKVARLAEAQVELTQQLEKARSFLQLAGRAAAKEQELEQREEAQEAQSRQLEQLHQHLRQREAELAAVTTADQQSTRAATSPSPARPMSRGADDSARDVGSKALEGVIASLQEELEQQKRRTADSEAMFRALVEQDHNSGPGSLKAQHQAAMVEVESLTRQVASLERINNDLSFQMQLLVDDKAAQKSIQQDRDEFQLQQNMQRWQERERIDKEADRYAKEMEVALRRREAVLLEKENMVRDREQRLRSQEEELKAESTQMKADQQKAEETYKAAVESRLTERMRHVVNKEAEVASKAAVVEDRLKRLLGKQEQLASFAVQLEGSVEKTKQRDEQQRSQEAVAQQLEREAAADEARLEKQRAVIKEQRAALEVEQADIRQAEKDGGPEEELAELRQNFHGKSSILALKEEALESLVQQCAKKREAAQDVRVTLALRKQAGKDETAETAAHAAVLSSAALHEEIQFLRRVVQSNSSAEALAAGDARRQELEEAKEELGHVTERQAELREELQNLQEEEMVLSATRDAQVEAAARLALVRRELTMKVASGGLSALNSAEFSAYSQLDEQERSLAEQQSSRRREHGQLTSRQRQVRDTLRGLDSAERSRREVVAQLELSERQADLTQQALEVERRAEEISSRRAQVDVQEEELRLIVEQLQLRQPLARALDSDLLPEDLVGASQDQPAPNPEAEECRAAQAHVGREIRALVSQMAECDKSAVALLERQKDLEERKKSREDEVAQLVDSSRADRGRGELNAALARRRADLSRLEAESSDTAEKLRRVEVELTQVGDRRRAAIEQAKQSAERTLQAKGTAEEEPLVMELSSLEESAAGLHELHRALRQQVQELGKLHEVQQGQVTVAKADVVHMEQEQRAASERGTKLTMAQIDLEKELEELADLQAAAEEQRAEVAKRRADIATRLSAAQQQHERYEQRLAVIDPRHAEARPRPPSRTLVEVVTRYSTPHELRELEHQLAAARRDLIAAGAPPPPPPEQAEPCTELAAPAATGQPAPPPAPPSETPPAPLALAAPAVDAAAKADPLEEERAAFDLKRREAEQLVFDLTREREALEHRAQALSAERVSHSEQVSALAEAVRAVALLCETSGADHDEIDKEQRQLRVDAAAEALSKLEEMREDVQTQVRHLRYTIQASFAAAAEKQSKTEESVEEIQESLNLRVAASQDDQAFFAMSTSVERLLELKEQLAKEPQLVDGRPPPVYHMFVEQRQALDELFDAQRQIVNKRMRGINAARGKGGTGTRDRFDRLAQEFAKARREFRATCEAAGEMGLGLADDKSREVGAAFASSVLLFVDQAGSQFTALSDEYLAALDQVSQLQQDLVRAEKAREMW